MSFDFSPSDILTFAQLTLKLISTLSATTGSSSAYQSLILDLSCVHRTLRQVEQMTKARQLSTSTLNALYHQVYASKEPIERFLDRTEKYRRSLGVGVGGQGWAVDSWRKIGWGLLKEGEVRSLRDVLQMRLQAINVLLTTAC